ncbi:MAG: O-antigen ligase family protein [Roseibium sp.]
MQDPSGLYGGLGLYAPHTLHKIWFPLLTTITLSLFAVARIQQPNYNKYYITYWGLFFAWSTISLFWAIEPSIAFSRLTLQMLVAICLYLAFCGTDRPKQILNCVFFVVIMSVFINLLAVLTQEPTALGHNGIFQHKNKLGVFSVLAMLLVLLKLGDGRRYLPIALISLPACIYMLILSQSKTSFGLVFVALLAGAVVALFAKGLRIPASFTFILGGIAVFLLSAVIFAVLGFSFTQQLETVTGDATFTGRTALWSFAWDYVEAQPWIGYGFRSFWQIGENTPSLSLGFGFIATAAHGHNGYIDILLGGGIIAVLLVIPILIISLNLCGNIAKKSLYEGFVLASFVIFVLLHNMFETTLLFGVNVVFVLFQIVWLYMVYTVNDDPSKASRL